MIRPTLAATFLLASSFLAPAFAAGVPVADFFRNPAISSATMSPAGKYVAVTVRGGKNNRQSLVVLDVSDLSKSKALAGYIDADIVRVRWVNEDRIVFSVTDAQAPWAEQVGGGLFAVDREGKDQPTMVIQRQGGGFQGLSPLHRLFATLNDGSNDVLVTGLVHSHKQFTGQVLLRLDTVTAKATHVSFGGPDNVWGWATDRRGAPRVAYAQFEDKSRLHWKATPEADWRQVWERPSYDRLVREELSPLAVDSVNNFYVLQYHGDEDTRSLAMVDMSQPDAKPKPLLSLKGYDFVGSLVFDPKGQVLGVHYLTDGRGTHWFDERLKAIQAKVDAKLPGLINLIDCGLCGDPRVVVVRSYSDRQPAVYQLYDAQADKFSMIGQSRPWIKADAMARRDMQRIKARDGLEFPVHVTRPKGQSGPAPTVVLVHGGPYVRGAEWQWESQSQFLASRGYVVVEPEYRGSTGFGNKLYSAGWKQWGLKMQDDIADATKWAIEKGYADPKRICIAGASYGGYATMMGLARYPELYRCGVNWVGVTDFELMTTSRWSLFSSLSSQYYVRAMIGEEGSKALLDNSPINVASKITQPVLMAYGGEDYRVPIQHGARMRDALAPHNKNVEWIEYRDEGHGWVLESNNVDFWTRVEKFLAKSLQ